MSYFFLESNQWFSSALRCRYLVVRFGKLHVPMIENGSARASVWRWAPGFFADGRSKVVGAWQDVHAWAAKRMATDLHEEGVELIRTVLGDDPVGDVLASLRSKAGRSSATALNESGAAGRHLQDHMLPVATSQARLAERAAAADSEMRSALAAACAIRGLEETPRCGTKC
ncbi:hypothetical protein ASC95_25955 [Pelomonas sp. Root1217]|nr:hypothetical protein ASC95_25955 [Pelomonas sp. Root1217]